MNSTPPTPAERRTANRRVGAAALAAFIALLVLAAARGPAEATPNSAPATIPGLPQQGDDNGGGGFRERRGGGGPDRGFGAPGGPPNGGGGVPDGSGGQAAPAPSTPAPSTGGGTT
jgi:hypothetical protein